MNTFLMGITYVTGIAKKERFLKKVYDAYYHSLCFYATKYIQDPDDAKDIVQEIFVKLWERMVEFENEYALSAYLYSGVYHACLNRLNLMGIHQRHHDRILQQSNDIDLTNYINDRIETEILQEIFAAIDSLPPECGRIFKLSYLEGYDLSRVAQELEISIHTVKSQRARGKKLLQERLKDVFPVLVYLFGI